MNSYALPLPRFYNLGAREYYDGLNAREIRVSKCGQCKRYRFPPQAMCPECNSFDTEWDAVSGFGRVRTFTVIEGYEPRAIPMYSWPDSEYPIVVVIVTLDEVPNIHLVGNFISDGDNIPVVGQAVEPVFERVTDDVTLLRFKGRAS